MDGRNARSTISTIAISGGLSGNVIAGCFALASFAVAILAGLASDNPAPSVLTRALLAMIVCYPVGMVVGMVCERVIAHHVQVHEQAHPAPGLPGHEVGKHQLEAGAEEQPLVV